MNDVESSEAALRPLAPVRVDPGGQRIEQAMRENDLDEVYRTHIEQLLARRDDDWRRCCETACEPCVLKLARVVDRARTLLLKG